MNQLPAIKQPGSYARHLKVIVFGALLFCGLAFALLQAISAYSSVTAEAASGQSTPRLSNGSSQQAAATVTPSKAIPAVPACTPSTANGTIGSIPLGTAAAGFTPVVDTPSYYQIYGLTTGQIGRQLTACAPRSAGSSEEDGDFLAYTVYNLSWQYSYSISDGQCTLGDIKVGQHVSQVLPAWGSSRSYSAALTAKWQAYITGVQTHENGHTTLDIAYGQRVLADLQALPTVSCATIDQTVKNTVDTELAALNQANDSYDNKTNHGATQGAFWH